ncbi:MAG: glycosyltransferase, partial [Pirellulales bacterium]|nr:glycosyltransferase [Pirellulales bacterium]
GRPKLLGRTLDSLARCQKPDIWREAIVVENGPKSGAKEIVESRNSSFFATRHLHVPRANKSHALNIALAEMSDECLVYFTDDDIRFDPSVLVRFAEAARGVRSGRFFGGPFGVEYEFDLPPAWLIPYLPWSAQGWMPTKDDVALTNRNFLGFNWAAYAGDVRSAGWFDPAFGPGSPTKSVGQETEMQMRLTEMGCRPEFVADATVWHYVATSRCTPEWAIQRGYRNGVFSVLRKRRRGARLLATAVADSIQLAPRGLRLALSKFSRDAETRFYHSWRFSRALGRLRGCQLSVARNRELSVEQFGNSSETKRDNHRAA